VWYISKSYFSLPGYDSGPLPLVFPQRAPSVPIKGRTFPSFPSPRCTFAILILDFFWITGAHTLIIASFLCRDSLNLRFSFPGSVPRFPPSFCAAGKKKTFPQATALTSSSPLSPFPSARRTSTSATLAFCPSYGWPVTHSFPPPIERGTENLCLFLGRFFRHGIFSPTFSMQAYFITQSSFTILYM